MKKSEAIEKIQKVVRDHIEYFEREERNMEIYQKTRIVTTIESMNYALAVIQNIEHLD